MIFFFPQENISFRKKSQSKTKHKLQFQKSFIYTLCGITFEGVHFQKQFNLFVWQNRATDKRTQTPLPYLRQDLDTAASGFGHRNSSPRLLSKSWLPSSCWQHLWRQILRIRGKGEKNALKKNQVVKAIQQSLI